MLKTKSNYLLFSKKVKEMLCSLYTVLTWILISIYVSHCQLLFFLSYCFFESCFSYFIMALYVSQSSVQLSNLKKIRLDFYHHRGSLDTPDWRICFHWLKVRVKSQSKHKCGGDVSLARASPTGLVLPQFSIKSTSSSRGRMGASVSINETRGGGKSNTSEDYIREAPRPFILCLCVLWSRGRVEQGLDVVSRRE